MAEYWKSKEKHYCKYCQIFINGHKTAILHHENGNRHKGNVRRFEKHEKQEKDIREGNQRDASAIVAELERVAMQSYKNDVKTLNMNQSRVSSTPSAASARPAPPPPRQRSGTNMPDDTNFEDTPYERVQRPEPLAPSLSEYRPLDTSLIPTNIHKVAAGDTQHDDESAAAAAASEQVRPRRAPQSAVADAAYWSRTDEGVAKSEWAVVPEEETYERRAQAHYEEKQRQLAERAQRRAEEAAAAGGKSKKRKQAGINDSLDDESDLSDGTGGLQVGGGALQGVKIDGGAFSSSEDDEPKKIVFKKRRKKK